MEVAGEDITELVLENAKALGIGELLRSDRMSLQDTMYAVELMNVKMDKGLAKDEMRDVEREIANLQYRTFTDDEALEIADGLLALQIEWHKGRISAGHMLSCIYLRAPQAVTHLWLRAFINDFLLAYEAIREIMEKGHREEGLFFDEDIAMDLPNDMSSLDALLPLDDVITEEEVAFFIEGSALKSALQDRDLFQRNFRTFAIEVVEFSSFRDRRPMFATLLQAMKQACDAFDFRQRHSDRLELRIACFHAYFEIQSIVRQLKVSSHLDCAEVLSYSSYTPLPVKDISYRFQAEQIQASYRSFIKDLEEAIRIAEEADFETLFAKMIRFQQRSKQPIALIRYCLLKWTEHVPTEWLDAHIEFRTHFCVSLSDALSDRDVMEERLHMVLRQITMISSRMRCGFLDETKKLQRDLTRLAHSKERTSPLAPNPILDWHVELQRTMIEIVLVEGFRQELYTAELYAPVLWHIWHIIAEEGEDMSEKADYYHALVLLFLQWTSDDDATKRRFSWQFRQMPMILDLNEKTSFWLWYKKNKTEEDDVKMALQQLKTLSQRTVDVTIRLKCDAALTLIEQGFNMAPTLRAEHPLAWPDLVVSR